ncbi:TNT domain-containing protein [Mycobacterium sp. IDR2000157661]|nr:TNT domain-containing protein [Mycobacterium sp. IDR2000157661]
MAAAAGDHEGAADNLGTAANRMELVHQDAENLAGTIKDILDDAAAHPAIRVNESTNQVIPPDTSHMTQEYAAQVTAKVSDLRERIGAALADGERIDAELAGAITSAGGRAGPAVKTAASLDDLLLPEDGGRRSDADRGEPHPAPDGLDNALDQLAGGSGEGTAFPKPGEAADGPAAGPVPLSPAKVEQFRDLARQTMLRQGVPPDQAEQRLDAMVAAAQKPLSGQKPPERAPMPSPGFSNGFADGWFNAEENIKDLVGANGWEELKRAWADMAEGSWERITNPIDTWSAEAEHLLTHPEHFLGELAGETSLTAPAAMFGGEAALGLRGAGAAIPDDVIDMPSQTGTVEQSTPTPVGGTFGGQFPDVPAAAPLAVESPLFDGYDPTPPGPEFTNPDGSLIYPDANLPSKPYAVPGTINPDADLPAGTVVDRFGSPGGAWLSTDGTPFAERALPPDSTLKPYHRYVVNDPALLPSGYHIEQSQVAPWFHQPGGGTQYRIIGPDGRDAPVQDLLDSQFFRKAGG